MEDSCPATPLILTGRDSKSPLQVALSSPESEEGKSPSRDSPDSRCVICLGRLQNKSFTDSCLHQFCFQCLLQWSKVKAECPLCKQPFKSIIHNVRSNLDYDQYHLEHGEPRYVLSDLMHSYNFDLIPVDRRFRYRSTMTRDYFCELAESFLAHTRRLPQDSYQINPLVPVDPPPEASVRHSNRLQQQRMRQRGTSDFRRSVYAQDLWVQDLPDISGRYRECTPQFYRENPAQIHRIIPWLNREVNVLLSDCQSHAAYVLSRIVSLFTEHPIRSREFREQIHTYFGDRTDHFVHELYTFARSVYDIVGFDQNAVYGTNPNYATEVQEISSSSDSDNSDIEVIETVKTEEKVNKKPTRQGLRKFLLKRAAADENKSDEPVAGPSTASDPIYICDSDPDEVKVLDYVKPEPEVVTISSEEEVAYSDLDLSNGEYAKVVQNERKRRSSSRENDKYKGRTRYGKGKCKSNGFGLKGRQKRKYIKSRRNRSSSSSSTSSTTSSSSSSSSSSDSESTRSDSTSSSGHKSKPKRKKSNRKKLKKKANHKSTKRRKSSTSDTEKKKKRVKSCVIVPRWSCDSSPPQKAQKSYWYTSEQHSSRRHSLKSYWSMGLRSTAVSEKKRSRDSSASSKEYLSDESDIDAKTLPSGCSTIQLNSPSTSNHSTSKQFLNSD